MDISRVYDYRFQNISPKSRLAVWHEVAPHIYRLMGAPPKVLDPAAGYCEFVNSVPAAEKWAVDRGFPPPNGTSDNLKYFQSDIMTVDLPNNYFDGIFVSNFLEHLPDKETLTGFLVKMHQCLAIRGTLAVLGPNFKYCYNSYFDCADHNLILTDTSVCEHLYAAGFEISKVIPKFIPYSFRQKLPCSSFMTRLYLRHPLAWKLFGKQFLILATKE